jgi:hypothetical protein
LHAAQSVCMQLGTKHRQNGNWYWFFNLLPSLWIGRMKIMKFERDRHATEKLTKYRKKFNEVII